MNTSQRKQNKNIFIFHGLTVALSLRKGDLPRKFAYVLYSHIKSAFPLTVCVFGSRFVLFFCRSFLTNLSIIAVVIRFIKGSTVCRKATVIVQFVT